MILYCAELDETIRFESAKQLPNGTWGWVFETSEWYNMTIDDLEKYDWVLIGIF